MESMESVLESLRLRMLERGKSFEPPCTEEEARALVEKVEREFGVRLPPRYLDLVRITDGLLENALAIFGSHERTSEVALRTGGSWLIGGLIEENRYYRDNQEDYDQLLIFARREGRLYAQIIETGEFIKLREADDSNLEAYESFEGMIVSALNSALN